MQPAKAFIITSGPLVHYSYRIPERTEVIVAAILSTLHPDRDCLYATRHLPFQHRSDLDPLLRLRSIR